ncbi:MAG TPA: PH domain-containing protein [Micromonosporaceae bacterium]|nr:PH domain-containing protein [Micromonosporaceae bacterium]
MPPRHADRPPSDDGWGDDEFPFEPEENPTEEFPAEHEPLTADDLAGLHYDAYGVPFGARRALPVEDEPSPLVARYMFPTERFRGEWRKHWIYLFDKFAIAAGATFVFGWLWGFTAKHNGGILSTIVIILWMLTMAWVSWRVADWYFDRFILTNKRLMAVSGMVSRTVAMMPLLRVTDMKYEQTPLGRILNYGTFVLESAGQEQALREVKHLPNPNELYLRIVEEMYEPETVEAKLAAQNADDGAGI